MKDAIPNEGGKELGSAIISYDGVEGQCVDVTGGQRGTWTITYTAGEKGIAEGGGIKIYRDVHKFWLGLSKQTDDPGDYDYCTASTDGSCQVELAELAPYYKFADVAMIKVHSGFLGAGERIFFKVGDTSGGGPPAYVPPTAQRHCTFWVLVDTDGSGQFLRLPEKIEVNVVPGPPEKLSVVAPSVVGINEDFRFLIRFEDVNCNTGAKYSGEVRLKCKGANLPERLELKAEDEGRKEVTSSISSVGVYRIKAWAENGIEGISNPVLCLDEKENGLYWGDMHCHTEWADGTNSIEENYIFGRDVAFLDVCGISEHIKNTAESAVPVQSKPDVDGHQLWSECQKAAEFYEPGRYVTFLAYEYTPVADRMGVGDHCVYFMDDKHELVNDPDISRLTERLAQTEAILIPHVGGGWTDWTYENRGGGVRCLVEVASMHEHSEWFGQEALQRGYKLGFVGMSDGHFGCPGYDIWALHGRTGGVKRRQYSVQSAITAIYAPELTREAIWQAMKERHVYATTGQRTVLIFKINGHPMGSELVTDSPPELEVDVHGTAPVARVEIIRNDRLVHRVEPGSLDVSFRWADKSPVQGESYYYLRVTQSDNAFAWSSPIWVTYTGPAVSQNRELPLWNEGIFPQPNGTETAEYFLKLLEFLKTDGLEGRFRGLEPVGIFEENRGRYLLVRGIDPERENAPIHIQYYLDFPDERVYTSVGWADYGQAPNLRADWPRPDTPSGRSLDAGGIGTAEH